MVAALAACGAPVIQVPDGARHWNADVAPSDASTTIAEQAPALRRIASTGIHACVVTTKGRVQCWGANRDGELGRGTESWGEPRPAWVTGIDDASEVAVGSGSTCVLHRSGSVSCWGEIVHSAAPRVVPDVTQAKDVTVDERLACAVVAEGDVVCWGAKDGPRPIAGIRDAIAVRAGAKQVCALLASGDVTCWARSPNATPQKIEGLRSVVEIVVGGAGVLARQRDGRVFLYSEPRGRAHPPSLQAMPEIDLGGDMALDGQRPCQIDASGRIGCKTWEDVPLGKSQRLADPGLGPAIQITANDGLACALHEHDRVSCWGQNEQGQLGLGDLIGVHAKPVSSQKDASTVRIAHSGACALDAAGIVSCWGGGDAKKTPVEDAPKADRLLESIQFTGMCAQPKDPGRDVVCFPLHAPRKAVPVVGLRGVTDQARHAGNSTEWMYAIVKGSLHAWRLDNETRKLVMRALPAAPNLVRVAADSMAVCVLDKNGKATCAKTVDPFASDAKHVWVPVEASSKIREMTVTGGARLCALEENGAVSCSIAHDLPSDKVRLVTQRAFSPATHIARGYNLCARGRDDVLRCATSLDSRGAGQGDQIQVMSDFGAAKDVVGLAATSTLVCAWTKSGEVACAGSNADKQLGIDDPVRSAEPREVALAR